MSALKHRKHALPQLKTGQVPSTHTQEANRESQSRSREKPASRDGGQQRVITDPTELFAHMKADLPSRPFEPTDAMRLKRFSGAREPVNLFDYCAVIERIHGLSFTFYMKRSQPWVQDIARFFIVKPGGESVWIHKSQQTLERLSLEDFTRGYRLEKVPDYFEKTKAAVARDSMHAIKTFFGISRSEFIKTFAKNYVRSFIPGVLPAAETHENPTVDESITQVIKINGRGNTALGMVGFLYNHLRRKLLETINPVPLSER